MAAHKWWRAEFKAPVSGAYLALTELYFMLESGATPSPLPTLTASSEYTAGSVAKLQDGNVTVGWATAANAFPAHITANFSEPVDISYLRLHTQPGWPEQAPVSVASISLYHSDNGVEFIKVPELMRLKSGNLAAGTWNEIEPWMVMQVAPVQRPSGLRIGSYGGRTDGLGVVMDSVVLVPTPGAPQQPMPGARVLLIHGATRRVAWQGYSDTQGRYKATGLDLGEAYIAVGIDPWGNHKTAAAGPVVATLTGVPPDTP